MPRGDISEPVMAEVRRLITRFTIERVVSGYSVAQVAREAGSHTSNVHRFESGETVPTIPVMVQLGNVLDLRLEWVPKYLQPLLLLTEGETAALIGAATQGWRHMSPGSQAEGRALDALRKLGRIVDG